MTVEEAIVKKLHDHGLWKDEAEAVIKKAKEQLKDHNLRWDQDISKYPDNLVLIVWIRVKHIAIKWLKENQPMHFAKDILEGV